MSKHFSETTTHVLFPRGVDYQAGLEFLKSTPVRDSVALLTIDWLPASIAERRLTPTAKRRFISHSVRGSASRAGQYGK